MNEPRSEHGKDRLLEVKSSSDQAKELTMVESDFALVSWMGSAWESATWKEQESENELVAVWGDAWDCTLEVAMGKRN